MINWHRLFGQALIDLFTNTPYEIELEKDLSLKQQFLDIVIIKKIGEMLISQLPDGFDDLGEHSLITYKSLREPVDAWALKELVGHYVNYRKQISDNDELLPESIFRLYAIATRFPRNLNSQIELKLIKPGVYDLQWGTDTIRLIVLNKIPKTKNNSLWCMFSGVDENVSWGTNNYQFKSKVSTILNDLFKYYQLEGMNMSYTRIDYEREMTQRFLASLTSQERLHGLSAEERLRGLMSDEVLSHYKPDEVLSHYKPDEVLSHYKPDEVLSHYKPDEILSHYKPDEILSHYKPDEILSHYNDDEILAYLAQRRQSKH